ncbi:helix-turn-helix domain-containing protein (plasmid) [Agrobacterium tumefaciens]|uniref:helix-turn-helix domain-containing protein n=1 Tax=Agrobacterium tumefaciens TaxID=358 RepID=UPI0015725E9D|nr:helix-turn-helix domain-containing protein [Agrobacterium tumefaciens]NSZ87654.1 helix-turn-helix domain-containing protein [Agrobacterium tumefaciens]WCA72980.1 helix-turn-helix domain-containing protein [Agrobacterium tumefaciens]
MRNGEKIPDAIDVEVGSRIRLQRKVKGMTQQALAAALGITFQQVQKYEKGSNRVGASRLSDIAQALEVPVSYFFAGSQAASEDGTDPQSRREIDEVALFLTSNEGVNLNRAFMQIPSAAVRQKVVLLVKSLARAEEEAQ